MVENEVDLSKYRGQNAEVSVVRDGNTVDIIKPGIGTMRILYGAHQVVQPPEQLSQRVDGLVLENASPGYLTDPERQFRIMLGDPQYSKIGRVAMEKGASIYFPDLPINLRIPIMEIGITQVMEPVIGIDLLRQAKLFTPIKNRRDFFTRCLKGGLGAWLATPLTTTGGRAYSVFTGRGGELTAEAKQLSYMLHPEDSFISVTLRNVIMAHKTEWLMRQKGNNPTMNIVLRANHVNEWPFTTNDATRLDFLDKCHRLGILPNVSLDKRGIYTYAQLEYDYNEKKWVAATTEVSELVRFAE